MSILRYVIYVRKSTVDDGKQQLSIPAQERELRSLATAKNLLVVGEPVRETRSAKEPGRPEFAKVMALVQSKKVDAILCWHLNRLARNPIDGGSLMWLLGTGAIKEILTPERTFTGSSDDKLMMSIIFGMATKDIDDLSFNIKRGNREALLQGLWPGRPKLGYLRDRATMKLVEDPARFPLVKEAFRLRRMGVPISDILRRARTEWGLTTPAMRNRGGRRISMSIVYRMLHDPFYAGLMVRREGTFPGTHPVAVTWQEFQDVQRQMERLGASEPRPRSHTFTYRGLLTCGSCGSVVTSEAKTNRFGSKYRYYHCCRKNRAYHYCPEPSLEEAQLEAQLEAAISRATLAPEIAADVVRELDRVKAAIVAGQAQALTNIRDELRRSEDRQRNLRYLAADGRISADEFDEDRRVLTQQQISLRAELEKAHPVGGLIEPLADAVNYAVQAKNRFVRGDDRVRQEICRTLFSNLEIKQKTLLVQAKFPFEICRELSAFPLCRPIEEILESHIKNLQPSETISLPSA